MSVDQQSHRLICFGAKTRQDKTRQYVYSGVEKICRQDEKCKCNEHAKQ